MKRSWILFTMLLVCSSFGLAAADGSWLKRVPSQDKERLNPLADDKDAVQAGAILYQRSCASCHGPDAHGVRARPSLRSERVKDASDGELHWLLTNGNLRRGMPSWSRLPDAQRWQLVRYLHSLPIEDAAPGE